MDIAALCLFAIVAFFQPWLLHSIEQEFLKLCPPIPCRSLGEIWYPFTNEKENANCGPFVVKGCDKKYQQIKLDRGSNKWYEVESIHFQPPNSNGSISISISITDAELRGLLSSQSCSSFNDLLLPNSQSIRFKIANPISLLKCKKNVTSPPSSDFSYKNCSDFNIFYTHFNMQLPRHRTDGCSIIKLPAITSYNHKDIFELLTATFALQVDILPEFYVCIHCQLLPGKCKPNRTTGGPPCSYPNGTLFYPHLETTPPPHSMPPQSERTTNKVPGSAKRARNLAIGLGCGAAVTILVILIIFWHRHNTKKASSNFLRANTFSGAISKSDLEGANICFGVSIFSYSELQEATNNFASESELGEGGFGTVYYGKLRDEREVAVKRLYERNYRKVNQFLNEIEILAKLRHKNLVSLYGCTSRYSRELLLVYEYIPNGTVADHLHGDRAKSSPLTWPIRLRIAIETANALVYLHASDIIHRDVKTNNILLDDNFCVKVADFGISRLFPDGVTHISTAPQGTPGYVDPEYFNCYQLTEKSDVYSFGVVLAELLSSMPAVDITRERHEINLANLALNRIQKCAFEELIDPFLEYKTDEEVKRMTTLVAELTFLCLQQDKEMRPGMDEVLEELKRIESGECESDTVEDDEEENPTRDNP